MQFNNNMNKSTFGNPQLNQGLLLSQNNNANQFQGNNNNSNGVTYVNNTQELPNDSVEQILFSPSIAQMFAAICWDSTVRLYNIYNGMAQQKSVIKLNGYPLCGGWKPDGSSLYVSCSDNSIYLVNFTTNNAQKIIPLNNPIYKMKCVNQMGIIICADTTNNLVFYSMQNNQKVFQLQLQYTVIDMSLSGNILLLALSDHHSAFIDVSTVNSLNPSEVIYTPSNLKSPLSSCGVNAQTRDFVLSTVDGRSQKSLFHETGSGMMGGNQKKLITYAFHQGQGNSHYIFVSHSKRAKPSNQSEMFNISSSGFNPRTPYFFYTAGADGILNFWDVKEKNKIASFNLGNPITAADVSCDGNYLAFGTGYDWSKGVWGLSEVNYTPKIGIKTIGQDELVYKPVNTFR